MKKIVWKLKYAAYMNRVSKCGWRHAWYSAGVCVEEYSDWASDDPEYYAQEEMDCWDW